MELNAREKHFLLGALNEANLLKVFSDNHAIIAGGALRSVFNDKPISDYDLYFSNEDDIRNLLKALTMDEDCKRIIETGNAVTMEKGKVKFQIIRRSELILPSIKDLFNMFDYTVCMAAYDIANDELYMDDNFLKHNSQKRLVFNPNTKYPLTSLIRLKKYTSKYGYSISAVELMKMGLTINKINISTYADLKEQLLGIDTLFLAELTKKLENKEMSFKKYNFDDFMFMLEEHMDKAYGNISTTE